jgi:hypothetical protein
VSTSKRRKLAPPSVTALREVFEKHLPYEIGRLVEQYQLLLDPTPYRSGLPAQDAASVEDALIVSFCTHARNLLEFFFRAPNRSYALATDYATASYKRLDPKRADVKRLYGQLCAQINHLTYDRTDVDSKKIGSSERKELVDIIYNDAVRLEKHLRSGNDKQHLLLGHLASATAMAIKTGAGGPSSQPTVSTLPSASSTTGPASPVQIIQVLPPVPGPSS